MSEKNFSKAVENINLNNYFKEISLEYDIEVLPYSRPRKRKGGGFYNPRDKYKKQLREMFIEDLEQYSEFPVEGELSIYFEFGLNPPKTVKNSKLKMFLAKMDILHPTTRPDIDNYVKPILDALNGVLYIDDGQIYELKCKKVFTQDKPFLKIDVQYREFIIKLR